MITVNRFPIVVGEGGRGKDEKCQQALVCLCGP